MVCVLAVCAVQAFNLQAIQVVPYHQVILVFLLIPKEDIYKHIHKHTHTHTHMCTCTHTCTHAHTHVHTYTCIHMVSHMHTPHSAIPYLLQDQEHLEFHLSPVKLNGQTLINQHHKRISPYLRTLMPGSPRVPGAPCKEDIRNLYNLTNNSLPG